MGDRHLGEQPARQSRHGTAIGRHGNVSGLLWNGWGGARPRQCPWIGWSLDWLRGLAGSGLLWPGMTLARHGPAMGPGNPAMVRGCFRTDCPNGLIFWVCGSENSPFGAPQSIRARLIAGPSLPEQPSMGSRAAYRGRIRQDICRKSLHRNEDRRLRNRLRVSENPKTLRGLPCAAFPGSTED